MHSATTVYLGSTRSNHKEVINRAGDPATFLAGLIIHLKSDETLSLAAADGSKLGVSLGRDLSDTKRTAICRKGLGVPVRLTNGFTPTVGAQVHVSDTTGKVGAAGAGFTAVNAVYTTAALTCYDEDGAAVSDGAALIDFPGGL